jgi:hypothetical protein
VGAAYSPDLLGALHGREINSGTIMDMHTGKELRAPASSYDDEVLSANWLPCPDRDAVPCGRDYDVRHDAPPALDAEGFLDAYYRHQE